MAPECFACPEGDHLRWTDRLDIIKIRHYKKKASMLSSWVTGFGLTVAFFFFFFFLWEGWIFITQVQR